MNIRRYEKDEKCLVMTREQVRAIDAWAIDQLGIPGVVLMENAGRSCAELLIEGGGSAATAVCIFCGTGNNGGDGFIVARHLLNFGIDVTVAICGWHAKIKGDARVNLDILEAMGCRIERLEMTAEENIEDAVTRLAAGADVITDAIFGTGLEGTLRDEYKRLIDAINSQNRKVLAVDIPSGLDCDTGQPLGTAIRATWTVTFVAVKRGFVTPTAQQYTGTIYVASIGIDPDRGRKTGEVFSPRGKFEHNTPV